MERRKYSKKEKSDKMGENSSTKESPEIIFVSEGKKEDQPTAITSAGSKRGQAHPGSDRRLMSRATEKSGQQKTVTPKSTASKRKVGVTSSSSSSSGQQKTVTKSTVSKRTVEATSSSASSSKKKKEVIKSKSTNQGWMWLRPEEYEAMTKRFHCVDCPKKYSTQKGYLNHSWKHFVHPQCPGCLNFFDNDSKLKEHRCSKLGKVASAK